MVSGVWEYCIKIFDEDNKKLVSGQCSVDNCKKLLRCPNGSAFGLKNHLLKVHGIDVSVKEEHDVDGTGKKEERVPIEEMIAHLIAVDGFSINAVAKSQMLAILFTSYGYNKPRSSATIVKMLEKFHRDKKGEMIKEVKNLFETGQKLSLSGDEWQSIRRRRFLNLNIHNKKTYNLGLVRIPGHCDAYMLKDIIEKYV